MQRTPTSQGVRNSALSSLGRSCIRHSVPSRGTHEKNHIPFAWACYTLRCPRLWGSIGSASTTAHAARSSSSGESTGAKEDVRLVQPTHATVLHDEDVTPLSKTRRLELSVQKSPRCALRCATSNCFKMVPEAAQARRHRQDARRATPPGRAKQTHVPCMSSILIPPSSRYNGRPFPHMQRSPAAPDKKRKDRQRTFPDLSQDPRTCTLTLPSSLTSCSARRRLPLPRSHSFSPSPPSMPEGTRRLLHRFNPNPNPDPRHRNPVL
jgi:hypothetical protein